MPWFPLPMPEKEEDLLDGFRRSTRPAMVSERPMAGGDGMWWGMRREEVAAASLRPMG